MIFVDEAGNEWRSNADGRPGERKAAPVANNRMYLKNTRTGETVYLAKYYPSTGWYTIAEDLASRLDAAFERADFGHLSPEDRIKNGAKLEFGPPHSLGGMYGAEWVLELEVASCTPSPETAG